MRSWLLVLAIALEAGACASAPPKPVAEPSAEAELLFSETFESASGEAVGLSELRGQVLLIDFFATWCAPCVDSLPVYNRWQSELGPRGFQVVVVSVDEFPETVPPFLARHAPDLRVLYDPQGRVAGRTGLEVMPTAFLLGREGRLLRKHEGFRPGDARELRALVDAALGSEP